MPGLFDTYEIKGLKLKNRIMMSSMCQYQAENKDATPVDWHFVHYTSRAIGGTGLVFVEMTNTEPRGRITEKCLGLWSEEQVPHYRKIVGNCHRYEAKVGLQIAHAGRKSEIPGGDLVGPSPIAFSDTFPAPRELSTEEIAEIIEGFGKSAALAVKAGFDAIELHGAHGYLLHQFISPMSNRRSDPYGEPDRFAVEVIQGVKTNMPQDMPLIMRISAVEYDQGGYGFDHMLSLIPKFIKAGVDAFDVSTGGNGPTRPTVYPGYQIKYAAHVKKTFGVPVINVGRLEDPLLAESVIQNGECDVVAIGRGMLKNPYWAKDAAQKLGAAMEMPGVYNLGYLV